MICPWRRSSDIDSSGICAACGGEVSQLEKEQPVQNLETTRLNEEENDINLQNIIDAAVSRQAAPSSPPESAGANSAPAAEDLIFQGTDDNESPFDLFVVEENDTPDASGASDEVNTIDMKDAADTEFAANIEDVTDTGGVANIEDATGVEDVVETETAAETKDALEPEDIADDENVAYTGYAASDRIFSYAANASNPEGRLIFLSRTLSGLVDLFLIALFSGIFLCVADYFTNAPILSSISVASFTTLFLMIYMLYSIFFLGTNNQTIGMMATDLRVVGMNGCWVSMSQTVRRSTAFLVSLFCLGIGLLAGVFSRKCLCLHDRLSRTRIVRSKVNQESVE